MTERSAPYILEGTISLEVRMLVFSSSISAAAEILEQKTPELEKYLEEQLQSIALNAMMNPGESNSSLLYYFDVRDASGLEVAGTEALKVGEITIDSCSHEDHEHEHEED